MKKWWVKRNRWQQGILLLGFAIIAISIGSRAVFAQSVGRVVSVTVDGQKQVVSTDASTVSEVLRRARIEVLPNDLVEPAVDSQIDTAVYYVNVYRAKPAVVVDGQNEIYVNTPYQNPRLIAERSAGLNINPEDGFEAQLIRDFVATPAVGQRIVVQRSVPISITVDGRSFETRTLAKNVADALDAKGIKLGREDILNIDRGAAILPGMQIVVKRVGSEVLAVEETIAAPVRYIYDGSQDSTYEKVQETGSDGKRLVTYQIVHHDGQEVGRKELQVVVVTEAVTRVVVKGTRRTSVAGADWAGLRFCESGGNYANKKNSLYRGAYQFSYATWAAMGGSGDPADALSSEQDMRAEMLHARSGRGQWPVCGPRYLP